MSLTQEIKDFALDLGYHDVGVTTADEFPWYADELRSRYSSYDYLIESPLKPLEGTNPRGVMPEAKSIICTVYDYSREGFPAELVGSIGRLYQSRSYNQSSSRINGARRQLFIDYLQKRGMKTLHGPEFNVPERLAAARAGVTTYGRNNFAYAKGPGSLIVLMAFTVDAELEYGSPTIDAPCPQDCRLCADACPTGALEPFRLEPRKCIAYNTFMAQDNFRPHTSSHIPLEIREKMGSWIHGCDLCQEACPRNRPRLKAMESWPASSFLEHIAEQFDLRKVLLLTDEYFETVLRPVMYNYIRHKRYFQRNAAIALGNSGDRSHVPYLAQALEDCDALVRGYAAWALGQLGGQDVGATLEKARARETDEKTLQEIESAIAV